MLRWDRGEEKSATQTRAINMLAAAAVTLSLNNNNKKKKKKEREEEENEMKEEETMRRRRTMMIEKEILKRRKPSYETIVTRMGAWEILDSVDSKEKKKKKQKKHGRRERKDALSRFLDDAKAVATLAPEVLPDTEERKRIVETLAEGVIPTAEKKPNVYVQRFKIDTIGTTGMVDNDEDAIEEEVEKAVRTAVGLSNGGGGDEEEEEGEDSDDDDDDDEASCEVRVLQTSEGVVAPLSFSSSAEDMDAIIVVVDFREKEESVPSVSFQSDDEEDERDETETNDAARAAATTTTATIAAGAKKNKEEEAFEGGIVKPDLETSLKSLHPFAISIRRLSRRLGEDNVFVVVTHCGDDYVEKRDWCELIDVPPENVTFCQSSFVHALSEDYNKNKSNKSSATHVDIPDRLLMWIDNWREERGKSLRSDFQKSRETVHFFAALKDAYFVPFKKKKKNKKDHEKEHEEEAEEEKKVEETKQEDVQFPPKTVSPSNLALGLKAMASQRKSSIVTREFR